LSQSVPLPSAPLYEAIGTLFFLCLFFAASCDSVRSLYLLGLEMKFT
jgi:hypothetical protein